MTPILNIQREYAIRRLVRLLRQATLAACCEGLLTEVERCFGRPGPVNQRHGLGRNRDED